jgi:hypothetical protein
MSGGGSAGLSGAPAGGQAGASAGAGGAGDCTPEATRPCSEAGLFGPCAAGTQTCQANATWGACSIVPGIMDTCEPDNDADCDGAVNEGCPCTAGAMRPCSDAGLFGKCAAGTQTCNAQGEWEACSIQPSMADTCVQGNDDDCSGTVNDACTCIENVTTRECGACSDGSQVCTNGRTGQFGGCTGSTSMRTYYRDADGDGYGSSTVTTTQCGGAPAGYATVSGDCCDDGGNLTLAAKIFPGQTEWFRTAANICGITWDYNCSEGVETSPSALASGCASSTPPCMEAAPTAVSSDRCGLSAGVCSCAVSGGTPPCMTVCQGVPVSCH